MDIADRRQQGGSPRDHVALGLEQLELGRVAAAVGCARRALLLDPALPEGFFLFGVAAGRLGRPRVALRYFLTAVRLRPDFVEAHVNLGHLLADLGRFDPAIREYRIAAKLRPNNPEIWVALGDAYRRWNRPVEAAACYQQALNRNPKDPAAWSGLGIAIQALGRVEDACTCYRECLRVQPGNLDVRNSLGLLLRAAGDEAEARACFTAVLAVAPDFAPATINLALLDLAADRPERAMVWCRRALAVEPGQADAWNNLGIAMKAAGSKGRAAMTWRMALVLDPGHVGALGNLGAAFRDEERFVEAEALLRRALVMAPQHAALHGILAYVLSGRGRLPEAEQACRRALALTPASADPMCTLGLVEQRRAAAGAARWFARAVGVAPTHALARFNRGLFELEQGTLAEGWPNYSYRFAAGRAARERRFSIPEWRGEPLAGKRLFIWREQGVGDEFLFASCYADAIAQAAQVIIECDRRLVPLFARSFPRAIVRAEQPLRGRPVVEAVDCDYHIAAGSLPRRLRTTLGAFPERSSWLFPDMARVMDWRRRLDGIGGALRVGIAWRSQLMTVERQWSYVPLENWGPVFAVPGVTFVNLQYDNCEAEIERAEARFGVPVYELARLDLKDDFENTAALIANLDLVIAPANSVAELSGALGVPVWRFGARDWTHLGSAVRPWYPSMRVFHPQAGEGLANTLDRIAHELRRAAAIARMEQARKPPRGRRSTTRNRSAAPAPPPKPH